MSDWSSFQKEKAYTDKWRNFLLNEESDENNSQELLQTAVSFLNDKKLKLPFLPSDAVINKTKLPPKVTASTPEEVIGLLEQEALILKDSIKEEAGGYLGFFTLLIKDFSDQQIQKMIELLMKKFQSLNEGFFDDFRKGMAKAKANTGFKKVQSLTNKEQLNRRVAASLGAYYLQVVVEDALKKQKKQKKADDKYRIKQPRDTSLSGVSSSIDKAISSVFNKPEDDDKRNNIRKIVRTPILRALKKDLQQAGFNVIKERRQAIKLDNTIRVLNDLQQPLIGKMEEEDIPDFLDAIQDALVGFLRKNKIKTDASKQVDLQSYSKMSMSYGFEYILTDARNMKDFFFMFGRQLKTYSSKQNPKFASIGDKMIRFSTNFDPNRRKKIKFNQNDWKKIYYNVLNVIAKIPVKQQQKDMLKAKFTELFKNHRKSNEKNPA